MAISVTSPDLNHAPCTINAQSSPSTPSPISSSASRIGAAVDIRWAEGRGLKKAVANRNSQRSRLPQLCKIADVL